jgi:uncharacterized protein
MVFDAYRPLLDKFLKLAQESWGEDLLAVTVFGSVARGEAKPASDIDLLMVTRSKRQYPSADYASWLRRLRESQECRALNDHGILSEPMPIIVDERKLESHPWLLLDIQECHITLYDPECRLERILDDVRAQMRKLGSRKVILENGQWYWDVKPSWKPGEVFSL